MRVLFLALFAFVRGLLMSKASLALENAGLRQQLAVYQRRAKRPRPQPADRIF